MSLRRDIEKKVERKEADIREWQTQIRELEMKAREGAAYVQALQETLKILPREASTPFKPLRGGTSVAKAYEVIKKAGRPLHVNELLRGIGRVADKKNRVSLSGSLAHYVRAGEIFTRPAPNTFGLVEQLDNSLEADSPTSAEPENEADDDDLSENLNGQVELLKI